MSQSIGEFFQTHILIVDDEEMLRESLVYEFKKHGFRVSAAESGRVALELLKKDPADVVISDIRMPQGNGIELLRELKKQNPLIPFVLLATGYSEITTADARVYGADGLLAKPFDRKALVGMVMNLLFRNRGLVVDLPKALSQQCVLTFLTKNEIATGLVTDIGLNGMFVCFDAHQLPELNEPVHFSIKLAEQSIVGNGIVTMLKMQSSSEFKSGCGIQFSYLSDSAKKSMTEVRMRI